MIVLTNFKQNKNWPNSNLSITRHCNDLLLERITQLERNNLKNAQYTRRETLKIYPMPSDIADDVLEQSVCQDVIICVPISFARHELEGSRYHKVLNVESRNNMFF